MLLVVELFVSLVRRTQLLGSEFLNLFICNIPFLQCLC